MGSSATLCDGSDSTLTMSPSLFMNAFAAGCGLLPTSFIHKVFSASPGSPVTNKLYVMTVRPFTRLLPPSFTARVAPFELNFSPQSILLSVCGKQVAHKTQQASNAVNVFMAPDCTPQRSSGVFLSDRSLTPDAP